MDTHPLSVRNARGQAFCFALHAPLRHRLRLATTLQALGFMVATTTPRPSDVVLPASAALALVRSSLSHKGRGFATA